MPTNGPDTIFGTSGEDNISGGDGDDSLFGYPQGGGQDPDGFDQLFGDGGNDTLTGGTGNDILLGGADDDTLKGGANLVYGDTDPLFDIAVGQLDGDLSADPPSDYLDGGAGNDTLVIDYSNVINVETQEAFSVVLEMVNGEGQTILDTSLFAEYVKGFERLIFSSSYGNDKVTATSGGDVISTGDGSDEIRTLGGDDIIVDGLGRININGGGGIDTLTLNRSLDTQGISFDGNTGELRAGQTNLGSAIEIENFTISGTQFKDTLIGNLSGLNNLNGGTGNDTITGGNRSDTLTGGSGRDIINGLSGNDIIDAGTGSDSVFGGGGADRVSINSLAEFSDNETYSGGSGNDTLTINFFGAAVFDMSQASITGFETLEALNFPSAAYTVLMTSAQLSQFKSIDFAQQTFNAITIKMTDNAALDFTGKTFTFRNLQLADGGQRVDASGGLANPFAVNAFVTILGGSGADIIIGRNEAGRTFTATGGAGNDKMTAGASDTAFDGGAGNDRLIGGSSSRDTAVFTSAASGVTVDLSIAAAQNTVGAGTDTISGFENLFGSAFADRLTGTSGINTISGGAGNDRIDGGAGNDQIFGFDGIDKIIGGAGADTLNAGSGADEYTYMKLNEGGDIISSFETVDIFVFKGSAFGGLAAGTLQASQFQVRAGNVAQDANDRFIFNTIDDTLWFDANGSGNGGLTLIADLSLFGFDLAASDIEII